MAPRVSYYHDESVAVYASVEGALVKPHILKLTHELIKAYGLPQHLRVCLCKAQWQPATEDVVSRFHTDAYVHFLQQLECNGIEIRDEASNFVLNQSVCFTETAWLYSLSYTGGSLAAAQSLRSGESEIAVCWMGGQTHARRDCASGFSFVNDVVLAILTMLEPRAEDPSEDRRVLYVNLDAWHCSGVEEAFYTTDRVFCLSLHHHADGTFPGSGGSADCGEAAGKHHTVNLPVKDGLTDADLADLFLPVLTAAAERFCPHAIVCTAGAGILAGDRLGCLNVTLEGHASCLKALMALEVPLLVLGSGGYTQLNTARAWCHATAVLCGVELADELPEHDFLDYYLPEPTLTVPPATMDNRNGADKLAALKESALHAVSSIPQRSKPFLRPIKRDAGEAPPAAAEATEAAEPGGAATDSMEVAPSAGAETGATDAETGSDVDAGGISVGVDSSGEAAEPAGEGAETGAAVEAEEEADEEAAAEGDMEVDDDDTAGEPPDAALDERIEDGMVADEPAIDTHDEA